MGKVEDYLRRKQMAMNGTSTMYVVESTPEGVTMKTVEIIEVTTGNKLQSLGSVWTPSIRYKMNESPFEGDIFQGDTFGQYDGYGSGFGDLWGYSKFWTLDKAVAEKLLADETKRVYDKYQNPNRPPEPEIIMPTG